MSGAFLLEDPGPELGRPLPPVAAQPVVKIPGARERSAVVDLVLERLAVIMTRPPVALYPAFIKEALVWAVAPTHERLVGGLALLCGFDPILDGADGVRTASP